MGAAQSVGADVLSRNHDGREWAPIAIGTGEERGSVDFVVVPAGQVRVQLTITGGGPTDLSTSVVPGALSPVTLGVGPGGGRGPSNTITFVPAEQTLGAAVIQNPILNVTSSGAFFALPYSIDPGNWIAVARPGTSGALFHFTISPGDADVPVNLPMARLSRVAGRVTFEGTLRPPSPATVTVDVRGAGPDAPIQPRVLAPAPVTPKADGTFDIANVIGTIELQATTPAGWTLKAFRYNGRDLLDDPLVLKSGEDVTGVQVVLSDQVATLAGITADSSGQPVAGCAVAVFPDEPAPRFSSRRMRLTRADQTGHFRVPDVPSGSYLAVAAADIDASIWLTPEFLDRLRVRATPLTLSDREQKTVTLACDGAR